VFGPKFLMILMDSSRKQHSFPRIILNYIIIIIIILN